MDVRRREGVGSLPTVTSSFVGRERELEKISTLLLGPARFITLTGPGGIGKTRLAVEALRRCGKAEARKRRASWVRLARLTPDSDSTAVAEEVAHAVIEADFSGRSAWDALVDTLAPTDTTGTGPAQRSVLVLDNCEHVLSGVGPLIADLIETVPGLSIVATSREPIGWIDEHLITVPPLSQREALALFRQRAELTEHPVTGKDQTTAAEICRHVHNHPLYIQLAAARLLRQPMAAILHGLTGHADDARLSWSHGPRVGTDPRHRGVVDVISWSYELCSDKERLLFDRLSVFAAGYDTNPDDTAEAAPDVGAELDAIETICCDDEISDTRVTLTRPEIEGLLERLVDQSLVTTHRTATAVRYSLVESLRVFAQQRLRQRSTAAVDEPTRLALRHCRYYHDRIAYAAANWFDPEGQALVDWARTVWANTLTAIETSITTPGRAGDGLEICLGLITLQVCFTSGSVREIRQWTLRCLAATRATTPQPTELQIGAMATIAWLATLQGTIEDAEQMLEDCVAACIPDPDTRRNWRDTAETDIGLPAPVEFAWGAELIFARRDARAITVLSRAQAKFEAYGDHGAASMNELFAALAAGMLGTPQQAHEITQRYLDRATISGIPWEKACAELTRSTALTRHGNPTEALALERSSLAYHLATNEQWAAVWLVQYRTWSLAQIITDSMVAGKPDRKKLIALATEIAHLAGGTTTLRAKLGIDIKASGPLLDESEKAIAVARRVLGPDAYAAAEARGMRLRPERNEVQRLALGTLTVDTPADTAATSHWYELTRTEQQVAILAAAGWTNKDIAFRRGKSSRTVDAQIAAIFNKLAITSRADISEHIPGRFTDQVRGETARRPR
ncbi:LuxR C-terminal-related transcriptional regulator [Nocardia sp. NPDC052278]|uniref:helix-turn-helix transcriptional regulator n=1 Tax=unclassified Nocardia TaxID=2637762 RepID=UPI0036B6355E